MPARILPLLTLMILIAAPGLAAAATPAPATPSEKNAAPEIAPNGEERLSLGGLWQFSISLDKSGPANPPKQFEDTMRVPGNWDATAKYSHFKGKACYRRTFTPPAAWGGSRVLLRFDAVYETAIVWLNGTCLGRHTCGYLPFEFDVTALLRGDGNPNEVIVMADSTYGRGAWWSWGGISRDVWLVRAGEVRLTRQHIRAEPDLQTGQATLFIDYKIENAGARPLAAELLPELRLPEAPAFRALTLTGDGNGRAELKPHSATEIKLRARLSRADVKLWDLDHPRLYALRTNVRVAGQPAATRLDRFGIRKVELREGRLLLNGEPIRISGFNRVSDDRVHGNTETDAVVRKDIDLMKSMGAGMARLMHFPQAPNLLDYLDEKGMMIFEEIPVWGSWDPNCFMDNPQTKEWLREEVERDTNHPCIIGWSVGNELEHHNDYVKSMLDFVRGELDPHRLASYISFTVPRKDYTPANDPATYGDMILWNSYGGTPAQAAAVSAKWPGKTQFISEFGAGQFGFGLDSKLSPAVFTSLEKLRRDFRQIVGVSLWTFNDYRSDYPGTYPNEERAWGVVNVWRQEKRAAQQVREQFSPVAGLELIPGNNKATLWVTPRGKDDMPSYVLRDYLVKWELVGSDGLEQALVINGGVIALPTLKPGDPAWSGAAIELPAVNASSAKEVVASLITPTGYVVHQAHLWLDAPGTPAVTGVQEGPGAVRVRFNKVACATGYRVLYGKGGLTEKSAETIADFIELKGLDPAAAYQLAVVAVNGKGESRPSNAVTVRPQGKPLPPVVLAAAAQDGGFTLGYSVEKDDTTFTLRVGNAPLAKSSGDPGPLVRTADKGATTVGGLKNGGQYYVCIKRQGAWGESGWSEEITVTPQAPAAPQASSLHGGPHLGGVVRGKGGLASLRFDPVDGATGYVVRCQAAGAAEFDREIHAAYVDQATLRGLDGGKKYRFAIAAVNAQGTSPFSEPIER